MSEYRAFLSYSRRYREWAEILHQNVERCLEHTGCSERVFFDLVDLQSGRSWMTQLQAGLHQARNLVLVVTPEALASPRVADEIEGFMNDPGWARGRFHVLWLVDCPLPLFLERLHRLDLRQHDDAAYLDALARLTAALLQRRPRDLPALPEDLQIPPPPCSTLPADLRRDLVVWTEPLLASQYDRNAIAMSLDLKPKNVLEGHATSACAASAALVLATGDDDPRLAALRVAETLIEDLEGREPELRMAELRALRDRLAAAKPADQEEPGLIGAFLDQMIHDHERLVPYFQERVELDLLERVHVQLELRAERPARLGKDEGTIRLHDPLTVRELLALDPSLHPGMNRRWVILGDPGAGKTTLLRHLAATTARESPSQWIPILESLPRLMREPEWLLDRITRQLRRAGVDCDGLPAVLDRAGHEGRLLLLIDGLDEVPREGRDEAEGLLRQLSERWPGTPFIVTSRPIGYRRPDKSFEELELLPLDAGRRREFLARWFGRATGEPDDERAGLAAKHLEEDPGLRELSSNPLYLTLMALLLEKGHRPKHRRTRLYDQVFALLLNGSHRPEGQPMEAQDAVRWVLRELAYAMTAVDRDGEPVTQLESRLLKEELDPPRRELERVGRWHQGLRQFFDDLAEHTGILGPHDGRDADWRFWHRTFREALAAEALEARLDHGGEDAILEHARGIAGNETRWAEPYALLTGRIDQPDELVRALVSANRALGVRAVATAHGLRKETLDEVLELSGGGRQLQKVYLRILGLFDDPKRALALIDQLRQRTRDGNELYFLDQAAAEVARRWPDHETQARQLCERLYDHIPPPPENLFQWIETPMDGRVNLWREIAAGHFHMGSPPEEDGRFTNEGPRHKVTIPAPFQLAVVPVTVAQYAAFDPNHEPLHEAAVPEANAPHHPVENVSWYATMSFCRWLSIGLPWPGGIRLPTEEEWEYVCRAGTRTRFWNGDCDANLDQVGWYDTNSDSRTHRVGEKPANPWGLYDLHGNVWEWTLSSSTSDYSGREDGITIDPSQVDPDALGAAGGRRVIRGGSYWNVANWARSAYRDVGDPWFGGRGQGLRLVLPAAVSES